MGESLDLSTVGSTNIKAELTSLGVPPGLAAAFAEAYGVRPRLFKREAPPCILDPANALMEVVALKVRLTRAGSRPGMLVDDSVSAILRAAQKLFNPVAGWKLVDRHLPEQTARIIDRAVHDAPVLRRGSPLEMKLMAFEDDFNIRSAMRYLDQIGPHTAEDISIKDRLLIPAFTIHRSGDEQREQLGHLLCTRHHFLFLTDGDLLSLDSSGRDVSHFDLADIQGCMVRAPREFPDLPLASCMEYAPSTDGNFYLQMRVRGLGTENFCFPGDAMSNFPDVREAIEQLFRLLVERMARSL